MVANEPCAEDLIPKNRQNNVYGHGHVNAQPAVEEAANYFYELSMSLNVTLESEYGQDNRVHIGQENRLYSIWKEEFKEYNGELGI